MPAERFAVAVALLVASVSAGQIQVDDRPKILEPGPLTKDELNRKKAEQLLRDARTLFAVGVMRARHEKLVDAAKTLDTALTLDPDSLEIRRALVPLYIMLGRENEAITLCRHVFDREPNDAEIAFQFARLLRVDGRPAEAIAVLQKAVGGKDAEARPERLLLMLADLSDLLEKQNDFAAVAKAQEGMIRTMTEKREQLLYGNGLAREALQANLGRAYERLGQARVQTKEYDRAIAAFRATRDTLLKSDDPEARHQAIRINWNLSEIATAQGRWSDAIDALDAYLDHSPAEMEPYQKKIELLRKVGRDREVVPALRKYAAREEFNIGLQLLLAGELAKEARTRAEAEKMYKALLEKNIKPEIYRGLFHLYRLEGDVTRALDLMDSAAATIEKADAPADDRETALKRERAMYAVLKSDPVLVEALLGESRRILTEKRENKTLSVLASLAARTRKLPEAEKYLRQCLVNLSRQQEGEVYRHLINVLMRQKKHSEIVTLCQDAMNRRAGRDGSAINLHLHLAFALNALGKYDDALVQADKAIVFANDDSKVSARCARAEILAHAGRYPEAIEECEDTLKEFTRLAQVQWIRQTLSNVYSLKGDSEKSEEQLRLILETDPDQPLANNNLGYQMADRNFKLDEAERLIRRAIEIDRSARRDADDLGDNAAYLDSLGWVLFRRGNLTEAREWLEKAAALPEGADDPTVWDHLGDVYVKLDLPGKAKAAWQMSLKLHDAGPQRKGDTRRAEVEKKLKTLDR